MPRTSRAWHQTHVLRAPRGILLVGKRGAARPAERRAIVPPRHWEELLQLMAEANFWNESTTERNDGLETWVLEGLKWGRHHVVAREVPEQGGLSAMPACTFLRCLGCTNRPHDREEDNDWTRSFQPRLRRPRFHRMQLTFLRLKCARCDFAARVLGFRRAAQKG